VYLEASITVRAPRGKVYAAYTDFESMPKWAKELTAVRITKREGDTVCLESEGILGASRRAVRILKLSQPNMVECESETRFTRTMRTVAFEDAPEGTKLTATLDVRVKRPWGNILSTREADEFEPSVKEELTSFARYVEGLQ
jgi:uncharacterized membrane protein